MADHDQTPVPEPESPEPEYEAPKAEVVADEDRVATAAWISTANGTGD
jgi:hypothetical protein